MWSMVAESMAATAHATARSRTRSASTSRRSGSRSLLSFRPRTGRSSERITAAAKTGPNRAPRPTSSTPATAWKPRARSSRSNVASQRNLPFAAVGCMADQGLFALAQAGGFALEIAQIVQVGATHTAGADHVDVIDHARVQREDAFYSLSEADFANRDAFAHAVIVAGNDHAL